MLNLRQSLIADDQKSNQAYRTAQAEFDRAPVSLGFKSPRVAIDGQSSFQAELMLIKNLCCGYEK